MGVVKGAKDAVAETEAKLKALRKESIKALKKERSAIDKKLRKLGVRKKKSKKNKK